jgi:hypothetical protein
LKKAVKLVGKKKLTVIQCLLMPGEEADERIAGTILWIEWPSGGFVGADRLWQGELAPT